VKRSKPNHTAKWQSRAPPGNLEPLPKRDDETPKASLRRLVQVMSWRVPTQEEQQEFVALVGLVGVGTVTEIYHELGFKNRRPEWRFFGEDD
jgi:hypothetical protein